MDARKPQWGHVTPDLEGTSKGVIHCLLVQVRCVADDSGGGRKAGEHVCMYVDVSVCQCGVSMHSVQVCVGTWGCTRVSVQ